MWSRACSRSCQHAQRCPEHTSTSEGRGHQTTALLRCREVVERTEVLHRELLVESYSGMLEKLRARGDEDDAIDVAQHVSSVGTMVVDEQQGVQLGLHEAQGDQVVVPHSQHLLQAVEGLIELAHQLKVRRVNEADGLRAVDYLRECAMYEGVIDIEMVHGPTPGDS
jgi:hypothetical protein